MSPETRRPAAVLGLRPRLVLAFLATAAVTLMAAALTLFSPLQHRLRDQAERDLRAAVLSARPSFEQALRVSGGTVDFDVARLARSLGRRADSRVLVTDQIPSLPPLYDTSASDTPLSPPQLREILRTLRTGSTTVTSGPDGARIATRLRVGERSFVLAAQRDTDDAGEVVDVVQEAFLTAALIGLGVALLLGLALVTTLLRRLERVRAVALRIADEGPSAPPPVDDSRDEVGDLARTIATMQVALRRQEAARRRFVATASHELRTPLTSLGGTLELLEEDLRDGRVDLADAHRQIALAQGEVGRLTHLAADLLDLSRLDAETPLRSEPVELTEVSRAVAAEFQGRARNDHLEIAVETPPGPCWGRGDPTAVARIVRILLDNALRFAPPGTAVRVVPAYHGSGATIEVADEGSGVPFADRDRIFERFARGAAPSGEGGFGLGLAIGRELAHRQSGRLELLAATDGRGGGARFRLTLPIEMLGG